MRCATRRRFVGMLLLMGFASTFSACASGEAEQADAADDAETDEVGVITEETFLSEIEIARVIEALKSDQTYDRRLNEACAEGADTMPTIYAYHTDSPALQITGAIPRYAYRNGAFEAENPSYGDDAIDANMLLYDEDRIPYLIVATKSDDSLKDEADPAYRALDLEHETEGTYYSLTEACASSTTQKIAFIDAAEGMYLYDGDGIWLVYSDPQAWSEESYDPLNKTLLNTSGLDALDRVSLLERQTFEYDSPELKFVDKFGLPLSYDSVATFIATFGPIGSPLYGE